MTIASDVIAEARRYLMASGREELNRLTDTVNSVDNTLTFDFPANSIATGSILSLGLELMHVWAVTDQMVTVQRAVQGSTPSAHTEGDLITVNPTISDFAAFKEINNELAALSSPATGLFQVKPLEIPLTTAYSYDLAADVQKILSVQWNDYGPSQDWPNLRRWDLLSDQETDIFPSGVALRLYVAPPPGRTLRVNYAGAFDQLEAIDDDMATTGLPASAYDIPAIGAAARLLTAREARRSQVDAQPVSRAAADVPPGSSRSAAAGLLSLRKQRIIEEAARLSNSWPTVMRPAV